MNTLSWPEISRAEVAKACRPILYRNWPKNRLVLLPVEAKPDVLTVCRFSTEQLQALVELFSSEESVPPFDLKFFEKTAERLHLDSDQTGSALSVATFLQNLGEQQQFPELRRLVALQRLGRTVAD